MVEHIYQLKIALNDIKPAVWRRVLVGANMSLDDLHHVIQIAMGWTNSHMHQFVIRSTNTCYSDPAFELEETHNSLKTKLSSVLKKEKSFILYEYDFGDSWNHVVTLEKILPVESGRAYPVCIDGKQACPPEDCGGSSGYEQLCDILKTPKHKEHKSMLEWLGLNNAKEFDPNAFDLEEVNVCLKPIQRKRKTA